jgi:hypothetical protein
MGAKKAVINGQPVLNKHHPVNSLTVRTGMRRLTRFTNAFSKRLKTTSTPSRFISCATILPHPQTLRVTPATEAGIIDHV